MKYVEWESVPNAGAMKEIADRSVIVDQFQGRFTEGIAEGWENVTIYYWPDNRVFIRKVKRGARVWWQQGKYA